MFSMVFIGINALLLFKQHRIHLFPIMKYINIHYKQIIK